MLPFTTVITFTLTLLVCGQVLQHNGLKITFPYISQLEIGSAYPYFVSDFVILCAQMLFIVFGRLQYLFQSQSVIICHSMVYP